MKKILLGLFIVGFIYNIVFAAWNSEEEYTAIMSSDSIPSTTSLSDCTAVRVPGKTATLAFTVSTYFNVSGGSDVVVGIYTSPDNSNYDTIPISSATIPIKANTKQQKTIFVNPDALWYKAILYNGYSSYPVTTTAIGVMIKN